jgi:primosomal protein N'
VLWTPCSGVEWVSSEPASGQQAATTRKQPVNLGTESAEDSLTAFIDYTPTVRLEKDHLDRDMLQRLTCSRTATVVLGVRCALADR